MDGLKKFPQILGRMRRLRDAHRCGPHFFGSRSQDGRAQNTGRRLQGINFSSTPDTFYLTLFKANKPPPGLPGKDRHDQDRKHPQPPKGLPLNRIKIAQTTRYRIAVLKQLPQSLETWPIQMHALQFRVIALRPCTRCRPFINQAG